MREWILFGLILVAFIATAFWEAYSECEFVGASRACDWRIKIWKKEIHGYHIFLWGVTFPVLLILPLIAAGFSWHLFRFIAAGYFIGSVLEDFLWFVVNPRYPFSKWNSRETTWYKWLKVGKFELPAFYLPYLILGVGLLFWRV